MSTASSYTSPASAPGIDDRVTVTLPTHGEVRGTVVDRQLRSFYTGAEYYLTVETDTGCRHVVSETEVV